MFVIAGRLRRLPLFLVEQRVRQEMQAERKFMERSMGNSISEHQSRIFLSFLVLLLHRSFLWRHRQIRFLFKRILQRGHICDQRCCGRVLERRSKFLVQLAVA